MPKVVAGFLKEETLLKFETDAHISEKGQYGSEMFEVFRVRSGVNDDVVKVDEG